MALERKRSLDESPRGMTILRRSRHFGDRILRAEAFRASLLFCLLLAVFFSTPIRKARTHSYCFADFLQQYTLTAAEGGHRPSNALMGDPAVEYLPWLELTWASLRAGKIPLWNPYNGGGVPHLGNYVSAVFSPYSLPFYVLNLKLALVLSAWAKLFGIGLFTYLFLRLHDLRKGPALLGATAFMFSGFNIVWLSVSHVGTVITLPASLYFAERALRTLRDRSTEGPDDVRRRRALSLAGLAASLAVGLLTGQPEVFYFSFLFVAAYIAVRLWGIGRTLGGRAGLVRAVRIGWALTLAGVIAAGIAALQLLPFFEYLLHSDTLMSRHGVLESGPSMHRDLLSLLVFPKLLGDPTQQFDVIDRVGFTNFAEATLSYTGATSLFLAAMSVLFARRDRWVRFIWVVAIFWVVYAYDVFGARALFQVIPFVSILPVTRSSMIWLFCVSWAAALCLDHLGRAEPSRRSGRVAAAFGAAAVGFLALSVAGAAAALERYRALIALDSAAFWTSVPRHMALIGGSFSLGVAAAVLLAFKNKVRTRAVLLAIVIGSVFWQTALVLKDFNPTVEDRFFYPVTPAIRQLRGVVGRGMLSVVGPDNLVADSNIFYGLSMPSNYDGLWIREYDRLYRRLFGESSFPRSATTLTEAGLKLFGVGHVILPANVPSEVPPYMGLVPIPGFAAREKLTFFRYGRSATRFFSVGSAVRVASADEEFALVSRPGFDPYQTVVLSLPGPTQDRTPEGGRAVPATVIAEDWDRLRIRVVRPNQGFLVLTKPFYPGWKATVNGASRPVLRANYAFSAVPVGAGESVVDFYYDPLSWKWGLAITAVNFVLGAALLLRQSLPARTTGR